MIDSVETLLGHQVGEAWTGKARPETGSSPWCRRSTGIATAPQAAPGCTGLPGQSPQETGAVYRPLFPEDYEHGDPYILTPPEAQSQFRYYVYTSGADPVSGRAFPVYASHDLVTW